MNGKRAATCGPFLMRIREYRIHSIAMADPPLRSSYGLHQSYALRNVIELETEDGIIGTRCTGVRGFAGLVLSAASDSGTKTEHVGIVDPRIAPSEGHDEVWEHFGITSDAILAAVISLA